ncbi:MAG: DUF934 domain-containing protein [Myxococcota bacterium]|nr:DUF934 domain-containing protein [Myxococcota bacterium]
MADEALPATGPVIVDLERWKGDRQALLARKDSIGVCLQSEEDPDALAPDLDRLALIALEFPGFKDGRAYSSARVLRERHAFQGELRAVGDVLLEHLLFMHRCGFDAFEIESDDPERDWQIAVADFDVWYQPTADGRPTALQRRNR